MAEHLRRTVELGCSNGLIDWHACPGVWLRASCVCTWLHAAHGRVWSEQCGVEVGVLQHTGTLPFAAVLAQDWLSLLSEQHCLSPAGSN